MAEQNYDFRARMLEVHRKDRRIAKPPAIGQIEVSNKWTITFPASNELLTNCALDLKDYFDVSMGVNVTIANKASDFSIVYEIDSTLEKDGEYRVDVKENQIRLIGKNERAAAQAGYLVRALYLHKRQQMHAADEMLHIAAARLHAVYGKTIIEVTLYVHEKKRHKRSVVNRFRHINGIARKDRVFRKLARVRYFCDSERAQKLQKPPKPVADGGKRQK